ncbi:hypothetical protein BDQ12DRAFT_684164 [Crucibulum laeve]|uniref:Uncharacterized protein n=1 Tax=Crucibulum laeve TaxID=68775 RepID=A0A5C3MAM2_9AGAR|nr:hypothetical protein BDQ12DRAFT_684164 [Crucibulum laeve]
MSAPIVIRTSARSQESQSPSSSVSSTSTLVSSLPTMTKGLYVPVHKRTPSEIISLSLASSPAAERIPAPPHANIYSIPTLLSIASSPLATLSPKKKEHIRSTLPELVMNRKMRKSIEYHSHHPHTLHHVESPRKQERSASPARSEASSSSTSEHSTTDLAAPTPTARPQPTRTPSQSAKRQAPRRNRPAGRAPERRRNALMFGRKIQGVADAASWRMPTVPLAM